MRFTKRKDGMWATANVKVYVNEDFFQWVVRHTGKTRLEAYLDIVRSAVYGGHPYGQWVISMHNEDRTGTGTLFRVEDPDEEFDLVWEGAFSTVMELPRR